MSSYWLLALGRLSTGALPVVPRELDMQFNVSVNNVGFNGSLVVETLVLHLDCSLEPLVIGLYVVAAMLSLLVLAKYLRLLFEWRRAATNAKKFVAVRLLLTN